MRILLIALGSISLLLAGASAPALQPGLWEMTMRMQPMNIPNLPPEAARAMSGKPTVMRNCIKPGDLDKAPDRVFASTKGQCSYSNFSMRGGAMRSTMECKGGLKGQMTGRYTPTRYEATSVMTLPGGMRSTSTVTGRRIGAC